MIEPTGIIEWIQLILSRGIFFVFGIGYAEIFRYFREKRFKELSEVKK